MREKMTSQISFNLLPSKDDREQEEILIRTRKRLEGVFSNDLALIEVRSKQTNFFIIWPFEDSDF